MDLSKHFDTYNLKARVFPALIAGLPTLALLFMLVPWDRIGLPHITAGTMGIVLLFAFADAARRTGYRVERKLGTRATPELWHRGNSDIPEGIKDRYRAFVASKIKLAAPTSDEEQNDLVRANDFYLTAGTWLRDQTRDHRAFPILFGENITYGFRRNLLGLKPVALIINTLVLSLSIFIILYHPSYFSKLPDLEEKLLVVIVAVVLHSSFMLFAVSRDGVREASRIYGKQLILSCETLMKKAPAAPKKATQS